MNPILHELQNKQWVWSATSAKQVKQQEQQQTHNSTGFSCFDKALNAGFPRAGLIHISSLLGCGELRLFLHIIQQQLSKDDDRYWMFIAPPGKMNAEFLLAEGIDLSRLIVIHKTSPEEAIWSAEQCAKSSACAGVFFWHKTLNHTQIRKLELAAQHGHSYCLWFDNSGQTISNLPLSLSLTIKREGESLALKINKQKQGWAKAPFKLPLPLHCRRPYRRSKSAHSQSPNVVNLHSQ